jgi:hypothetical protein
MAWENFIKKTYFFANVSFMQPISSTPPQFTPFSYSLVDLSVPSAEKSKLEEEAIQRVEAGEAPPNLYLVISSEFCKLLEVILKKKFKVNLSLTLLNTCKLGGLNEENRFKMVSLLLEYGADPNAEIDKYCFWGTLHWTAKNGNYGLFMKLIEKGASLQAAQNKQTLLHAAVCSSHDNLKLIEKILDLGICINERDSDGKTALHWACLTDTPSSRAQIQFLLSHGADTTIIDNFGKNPIDEAMEYNQQDLAEWLEKYDQRRKKPLAKPTHLSIGNLIFELPEAKESKKDTNLSDP